ncbi:MAG: hypothetical protein ACOCW2_00525 [Chitinivibrionales bacterium]
MSTRWDIAGVTNGLLSTIAPETVTFYGNIVDGVKVSKRISITDEEKTQIINLMIRDGISLKQGQVVPAVVKYHSMVTRLGKREEYVDEFIKKGEIDPSRFSDQTKSLMVNYLINRGTRFNEATAVADIAAGKYDEHFFAAYDHALRVGSGQLDPLDATQGEGAEDPELWDFSVATFDDIEEKGIVPENIRAAGAIDYIYELGERLGIFRIVDALVLNWASGAIDVVEGPAAAKLYTYWKRKDDRSTAEERGMLYRRVLNKGNAQVLDRMVINEYFGSLWGNLMTEVAEYIEKTEKIEDGISETSPVSRRGIYQATRELQYNLTEYCIGMAHMNTREIYAQLRDAVSILDNDEIKDHFGGSRRKSMWSVIEQLSKKEFGHAPNIGAHRTLAVDGNRIFSWIADFNEATTTHDQFLDFLYAAESYILTAAGAGDEYFEEESERQDDEFSDDSFEDEFDDF